MTYKLFFLESVQKEWNNLSTIVKEQFKKKLRERIIEPHILKDRLVGLDNCYKIKLRALGYRLIYKIVKERLIIQVVAIGKRDKNQVYETAHKRTKN